MKNKTNFKSIVKLTVLSSYFLLSQLSFAMGPNMFESRITPEAEKANKRLTSTLAPTTLPFAVTDGVVRATHDCFKSMTPAEIVSLQVEIESVLAGTQVSSPFLQEKLSAFKLALNEEGAAVDAEEYTAEEWLDKMAEVLSSF